jgi:hypothetical protein
VKGMGWREISMQELKKFLKDWKSKKDLMEKYSMSESAARHCFNYLKKSKTEFEFREAMGDRRRCHQLRTINNE